MSATRDLCEEQQATVTSLTVVEVEQGYVAVLQVSNKCDDVFALRFRSSFLDKMPCDDVRV